MTIEEIDKKKFDGQNACQVEVGSLIAELTDTSTRFCNQTDFDKIIDNVLSFYNDEFNKVDFIAELQYLTTKQGGRKTPANSGYRPQVKFNFTEMQTSGQQTFIDKDTVYTGNKVDAKIKILSPDYFTDYLIEGMNFEFREGSTLIGTGQIKYIVNDKLEKPAGNRRLAKKRVQWLNEALCFVLSSVLADCFVLQNPLLRQALKR